METSKLSQLFHLACSRIHEVVDDLYETLHNEEGIPIGNRDQVEEALGEVKTEIYHELDLIKSSVDEYDSESEEVQ